MKKFLIAVVLLFVVFSLFAQTVDEYNGFNWVTWKFEQKIGYIVGFMNAYTSVMRMYVYNNRNRKLTDQEIQDMNNMFYLPLTIADIGEQIDKVYSTYSNRKYLIWEVLLQICGKDWWNQGEGATNGSS
jgi:hypothetical protein